MDESNRKTELLVGLFVLVGMLLLAGLTLQFSGIRESFRKTYFLDVRFVNATGINKGSPVVLGGTRVGRVEAKNLQADSTGVLLRLKIYDDVHIPTKAVFTVGTAGLMGDGMVEIRVDSTYGEKIEEFFPHDHVGVIRGDKGGDLATLQDAATSAAKKVDLALDDVRIALVDVKEAMKRVNEGALSDQVTSDFRASMEHLKNTLKRVDDKVLGEENAEVLKKALEDIQTAAASFKKGAASFEESAAKLTPMIEKLDPAISRADKVMVSADDALISIKKGADDFAAAARAMQSGNGLMAALLNDPALKNEFSDLISNLKRRGFLFYRDASASGSDSEGAPPTSGPTPEARRQLFKR